jgi:Xaa-Pro dipeptidase
VAEVGVAAALAACQTGVPEIEVDGAGTSAVLARVAEFPEPVAVEQLMMTPTGPGRTVLPHVLSSTRRLIQSDGLIHTRQVGLNGYRAELERTAFVGRVDGERARLFETVAAAQRAALDSIAAGVPCRDVDAAARRVLTAAGLERFAIHRTGHGIGLSPHEPPYLRFDEEAPLEENMVITIEPGAYIPGVGGFRHSDTVIVSADGCETVTSFPTALQDLTLGADRRAVSWRLT